MADDKRQWRDLSRTQQRILVAAGIAEVVLTTVALVDLARRPAQRVHGPKSLWVAACFVQPIGPIAYVAYGRR